jgi:DNA-binding HxlR family transcriptional regulator
MHSLQQSVGCVQAATDVIGDKWTPLLLRYFINEEVVRFCQLQDLVGGINPRTLSARLDSLEAAAIIQKVNLDSSSRCEYRLTQKGHDLLPILQDMEAWSEKYTFPTPA